MPAPEEPRGTDVEMRRRILQAINRYPGLHLREIQRRVESSVHLVEYHLNMLERLRLATSHEEGGYRRFFPATGPRSALDERERAWLSLLRQNVPLGVTLYLLDAGTALHKELADVVPITKSTLTYHLKNMERAGLITREAGKVIRLTEPERVLAILRSYRPTPDLIASWGDMWVSIVRALDDHEGDAELDDGASGTASRSRTTSR